jgi:outer membrane protein OmpA-like peptidoglycan-associated protein
VFTAGELRLPNQMGTVSPAPAEPVYGGISPMKRGMEVALVAGVLIVAGAVLGGCATKKYVGQRVDPVNAKADQIDKNQQATQKQLEGDEPKISAADEKATSADARAGDALANADAASKKSDQVRDQLRGELNDRIANLDDYKTAGDVTVLFKFNSDKLTDDARQQLDQLASGQMGSLKRYFIAIQGFTDKIGTPEYNLDLSRRRAQAVQTYLVASHNVPVYRIQIVGLGKDKPVNDEKTKEDREKNRRVEVTLFSADGGNQASQNRGSGQ